MRPLFSILLAVLLIINQATGQSPDSLYQAAQNISDDSARIRMYNKIAFAYIFQNPEKALKVLDEGEAMAKKTNNNFGLIELINTHGIYMDVIGKSDQAKVYYEEALELSRKHNFQIIEVMCINNLGMLHWNTGKNKEALSYFFKALEMYEKQDDEKNSASPLNNIGLIYQDMNLPEKALEYHRKALAIREKHRLLSEQPASLNNIAINLVDLDSIPEAISTYKKGLAIAKQIDDKVSSNKILNNLANAYFINEQYDMALPTYLESLKGFQDLFDNEKELLHIYNNLAAIYNLKKQPHTALDYAHKGLAFITQNSDIANIIPELYLTTSESYFMLQKVDSAWTYRDKYLKVRNNMFSKNTSEAIAQLEIQYESQKKENELLESRALLAEKKISIQNRNYLIIGIILLSLIISGIIGLSFQKQKQKNKQIRKETELKLALNEIKLQEKLQEQKLSISRDLHDNIGAHLTFIISSLETLKHLFGKQDNKLNEKLGNLRTFTQDTIWELRDTIWAMNKNTINIDDLVSRVSNFLEKVNYENANTQIIIDNKCKDTPFAFDAKTGMNLYRILQEAISNAIKHAKPHHITITFDKETDNFSLIVKDDGTGFDTQQLSDGNGLYNMRKRTSALKGLFNINSLISGTTISVHIPMQSALT